MEFNYVEHHLFAKQIFSLNHPVVVAMKTPNVYYTTTLAGAPCDSS